MQVNEKYSLFQSSRTSQAYRSFLFCKHLEKLEYLPLQPTCEPELSVKLLWCTRCFAWGCLYCVWKFAQEGATAVSPLFSHQHQGVRLVALRVANLGSSFFFFLMFKYAIVYTWYHLIHTSLHIQVKGVSERKTDDVSLWYKT